MTELAIAEHQRRLAERVNELELRVDLLVKVIAGLTSGALDRPAPVTRLVEPQPWQHPSPGGAL